MALLPSLESVWAWVAFAYGVFTFLTWKIVGAVFRRSTTEKERLEFLLAEDAFWNLSKSWRGLAHHFLTLRNGLQLHYVASQPPPPQQHDTSSLPAHPILIFIHGFPDSWALWRHILSSSELRDSCTMIALDLPGYGGSDSLQHYGATDVLEALTEFVVAIREKYGVDDTEGQSNEARRVIIVGHDWGAFLGFRLASEAPQLADRFVLMNGPLMPLVRYNTTLAVESAAKMLKTFLRSPFRSGSILLKAFRTLKPVLRQFRRSSYVFAFQLPLPLVSSLGMGANYHYLKAIHRHAAGSAGEYTLRDAQDSLASTLGPGQSECETVTANGERYSTSVRKRQAVGNFGDITAYYRHGIAVGTWKKSLESISSLHAIRPLQPRRASSGVGLFDPAPGVLQARATVLWGMSDIALETHLVLDGIADYLVCDSQVIGLPNTGHFLPVELEGRTALEETLKWVVGGEKEDLFAAVAGVYPAASLIARK